MRNNQSPLGERLPPSSPIAKIVPSSACDACPTATVAHPSIWHISCVWTARNLRALKSKSFRNLLPASITFLPLESAS